MNLIEAAKLYFLGAGLYFFFVFFVKNSPSSIMDKISTEFSDLISDGFSKEFLFAVVVDIAIVMCVCCWWALSARNLYRLLRRETNNS